ncbi:uncharacterized protein LOC128929485 isoform X1 [Callithrix jacchus]
MNQGTVSRELTLQFWAGLKCRVSPPNVCKALHTRKTTCMSRDLNPTAISWCRAFQINAEYFSLNQRQEATALCMSTLCMSLLCIPQQLLQPSCGFGTEPRNGFENVCGGKCVEPQVRSPGVRPRSSTHWFYKPRVKI